MTLKKRNARTGEVKAQIAADKDYLRAMVQELVENVFEQFAKRRLEEKYPHLIVTRYEQVRENGISGHKAVQIAIGINEKGRRCVLAVEVANRESLTSWQDFLLGLTERGLHGVQYIASDEDALPPPLHRSGGVPHNHTNAWAYTHPNFPQEYEPSGPLQGEPEAPRPFLHRIEALPRQLRDALECEGSHAAMAVQITRAAATEGTNFDLEGKNGQARRSLRSESHS